MAIDMAALSVSVAAVQLFLSPAKGETAISEAIGETNLLELLIGLPQSIKVRGMLKLCSDSAVNYLNPSCSTGMSRTRVH